MAIVLQLEYAPEVKTWVAVVLGKSPTYGLDREFVAAFQGKTKGGAGIAEYLLDENRLYEICEMDDRYFVLTTAAGEITFIEKAQAMEMVAELQKARKTTDEEVNRRIAKLDSEGGFTMQ